MIYVQYKTGKISVYTNVSVGIEHLDTLYVFIPVQLVLSRNEFSRVIVLLFNERLHLVKYASSKLKGLLTAFE